MSVRDDLLVLLGGRGGVRGWKDGFSENIFSLPIFGKNIFVCFSIVHFPPGLIVQCMFSSFVHLFAKEWSKLKPFPITQAIRISFFTDGTSPL